MNKPPLLPPGKTTVVHAERALVLAPHYDDEVVGCGGLLAQLSQSAGRVRVLFLSDSSGGGEGPADGLAPDQYSRARRNESRKVARLLGLEKCRHLGLVDGDLHRSIAPMAAEIERQFKAFEPDLILVPSPLELTADHRATFQALWYWLHPLREQDDLFEPAQRTRILTYEVNHAQYPNLLVDVSDETQLLAEAMQLYSTQQKRHDYAAAAIGLRQWRALTLPPTVTAAEAYRQLSLDDMRMNSFASLVAAAGGREQVAAITGPKISIVVRTYNRPTLLREALASLEKCCYAPLEVIVVNDAGASPELAERYSFELRVIELQRSRGRAGAANAGIEAATGDYVGFLDDDDLVMPEHLGVLAAAVQAADVRVAYTDAAVGVYDLGNGSLETSVEAAWCERERRLPYSRDFDPDLLLLDNYIPFHTLLIERDLLTEVGPLDEQLPIFEDWDLLIRLSRLASFHHLPRVTCEYRHFVGGGQVLGGRDRDRESSFQELKSRVLAKHLSLLRPTGLAAAVSTLRRESVELAESRRQLSRCEETKTATERVLRELEAQRGQLESAYRGQGVELEALREHATELERANGELDSLRRRAGDLERVDHQRSVEIERLFVEERRLGQELEQATAEASRWRDDFHLRNGELAAAQERYRQLEQHRGELEEMVQEWQSKAHQLQGRVQALEQNEARLREAVAQADAGAAQWQEQYHGRNGELAALRDDHLELLQHRDQLLEAARTAEERYHSRNGELAALRQEHARVRKHRDELQDSARVAEERYHLLNGAHAALQELSSQQLEAARREVAELSEQRHIWEQRYHQRNGEAASLRDHVEQLEEERNRYHRALEDSERDRKRLREEVASSQERGAQLSQRVEGQNAQLGQLYAEIERLEELRMEMEATRAWRLHRFAERLRPGR